MKFWIVLLGLLAAIGTLIALRTARRRGTYKRDTFIIDLILFVLFLLLGALCISETNLFVSAGLEGVVTSTGILGIVVGLAAQESFSNIIAGIMIKLNKPYVVGDRIQITSDNVSGKIKSIDLRQTVVETYTRVEVIIPNSRMNSAIIENSTNSEGFAYPIEVTIAYEDAEKRALALKIMEDVISSHPKFYDRRSDIDKLKGIQAAKALCIRYDDSGIRLKILMWTKHFYENTIACSECRMTILERFEEAGIEIPYNKTICFVRPDAQPEDTAGAKQTEAAVQ